MTSLCKGKASTSKVSSSASIARMAAQMSPASTAVSRAFKYIAYLFAGFASSRAAEISDAEKGVEYLHRGIAQRSFEHRFQLADHVKVVGANLRNGLLDVELAREVPEAMKPRKIEIGSGVGQPRVIEATGAAKAA